MRTFRIGVVHSLVRLLCPETLKVNAATEAMVFVITSREWRISIGPRKEGGEEGLQITTLKETLPGKWTEETETLDVSTPVASWEEVLERHAEVVGKITTISREIERKRTEERTKEGYREWERKALAAREFLYKELHAYRRLMSVKRVPLGESDAENKRRKEKDSEEGGRTGSKNSEGSSQ